MAKRRIRRKHPDTGEEIEEEIEEGAMPVPVAVESNRPKTISYNTPEGIKEMSTDPTDLDEYEGEYTHLSTGETFGLKVVENDPHGKTHHLKNVDHYWVGTADEYRKEFEKQ